MSGSSQASGSGFTSRPVGAMMRPDHQIPAIPVRRLGQCIGAAWKEARKEADKLACVAWNQRMLGFKGPAQPSPTLGEALNAGYGYLEVRCLGCDTHQTVAFDIVRRPKATPIHELERYMRARIVRRSEVTRTSAVIWLRCG